MLSTTLREGLRTYAIGPKIRAIRLKKKMGLVDVPRAEGPPTTPRGCRALIRLL